MWPCLAARLSCPGGRSGRARQAGRPKNSRTAEGHLIEGAATQGWREALAAFDKRWPGRIPDWAI